MKKVKYTIFTIVFAILFILSTTPNSEASFYIKNFDIDAQVTENGDMEIIENIEYYSTETKNGVTRDILTKNDLNKNNSADGFKLESVLVDGVKANKVISGSLGQDGVYEYSSSNNKYSIKVYMPFSSSLKNRTVTYKYTLENVAVKYNDIGELFWNFIGDKWDTNIENVHIKIILPNAAANDTIYVYGHGSDNGRFEKQNNIIDLYASNLKAYQALDARILFTTSAIPGSNKIINKNVLDNYINQEEGITKEREEPKIIGNLTIKQLALILSIAVLIIGIVLYFKYDKEYKAEKVHYYREIPYNLSPEILQTVYYGKVQNNAFFITFLNLVKKGVYKISKIQNKVGRETQLITYNKNENIELEDYENILKQEINSCFIGRKNEIELLELENEMQKKSGYGFKHYKKCLENKQDKLFGKKTKVSSIAYGILIISMIALIVLMSLIAIRTQPELSFMLIIFLAVTTLVYTTMFGTISFNLFTVLFLLVHCGIFQIAIITMLIMAQEGIMYIPYIMLFILLQYVFRIQKSSKEERQIREQIKGLRRYIKDYSYLSEKEDIEQLNLWEDYFILAIALKLNTKTVNYFYDYCKDNIHNNFGESLGEFNSYRIMSSRMGRTFVVYSSTSSTSSRGGSSYSGSSGGFSGGSSSGGGGRRWRRRKLLLKYKYKVCISFWAYANRKEKF